MASYELNGSNISVTIEDAMQLSVNVGESAKMEVSQAVNYIQSGKAEVQAAVVEGMAEIQEAAENMANKDLSNLSAIGEARFSEKQDIIDDLNAIRSGAAAGTTAVQPSSLASVATSGSYNDLSNKPDLSVYALDNAVVHLSGNETINGDKLFKGQAQFTAGIGISFKTSADDEYYVMRSSGAPSLGCGLFLNNSVSTAAFNVATNKITIGSGTILPNSVTPATSDSSTRIATTAYVKSNLSNYVSLEGNETIGGTKTFVVDPYIKNPTPQLYMKDTQQTKGTAPSADVWGGIAFQDANGNLMGRCRQLYTSGKTNMVSLYVYKANSSSDTDNSSMSIKYPASGNPYVETGAYFRPSSDNSLNLGDSSHRWKQLYAGTTTISTSDERLKQDIENISDEILDVWGKVEFYRYKFKDAVAEKGKNARYHTGLIAQRIERIFAEHGLNAFDYGLLCYDEWQEQKEEKDEEGNIITPKIEAGNRYSLRYEECLCMEAAYQRYRADKIEARLAALEARV